jgi:hypothetical protein
MYTRVESLLRLAEDPGISAEERANAMAKVAAIVTKYQIDTARLNPHSGQYTQEEIVTHTFTVPSSYGVGLYRNRGIYLVVGALGGKAYTCRAPGTKSGHALTVYAAESTMNVLQALLPSLIVQEMNALSAYIRRLKEEDPWFITASATLATLRSGGERWERDLKSNTKVWNAEIRQRRTAFCMGFFVEAAKQVKEKRQDAVQGAGEKYAVVLVDTADRIAQAMADLNTRTIRQRKARWNLQAWGDGSVAGQAAMVGQTEMHGGRIALEG